MTFPKSTSENDPTTETVGEGFGTAVKREDDDDTGGGRGGGGRRGHLRRRRHPYFHVSPCGRGLGLAGVILLWICYAALFGGESEKDYRGSNNNKDGTGRN